jgi:uncharacterized repeat protein (TIGR01451 family)
MKFLSAVYAVVLCASAWSVHAAGSPEVVVDLQVRKVLVQKDGTETLVDAAAGPGETLEYQATYANRGAATARNVQATLPVPEAGMAYLDASATPGKFSASVDGKQFAPAPLQRVVILPDGSRRSEAVPPSEYRFLRWNLGDLDAGKSAVVRSRMRLTGPLR